MTIQAVPQQNNDASLLSSSVLLHSIRLVNFLSFGHPKPALPLLPLNVLIGSNGSGKSNLIEGVSFLRSAPVSLADVIRKGGGVREWIWKGQQDATAWIEAMIAGPDDVLPLRHHIAFTAQEQAFRLLNEEIDIPHVELSPVLPDELKFYQYHDGRPRIRSGGTQIVVNLNNFDPDASILAQRRDPEQYPQLAHISEQYAKIRIYREWGFGRNTVFRQPQRTDMRTDRLEEDFSNLGLFLNRLKRNPQAKKAILAHLRDIYEGVDDFDVSIEGGTVQVFLTEGAFTIPATRLSDGTLRYLCLLAILCDPKPPPLICIEEPELGLHPDILPKIADLLVEASKRTQLIVTTHSDILIDAMTERPESVVVCEKHNGQTQMTRLSAPDLSVWLEKYRLGELWTRGDLGGTRW